MKITKSILDFFSFALNGVIKQYPAALVDIAKIEGLRYYLKGILAARECLIFCIQMGFGLILILTGIVVLHAWGILVLFLAVSWSILTKLIIVFLLAIFEIALASFYIRSLLLDRKWLKFSKVDLLTARLLK